MALSSAQRDALVAAEQSVRMQVRDRLVAYARELWGGMGSWRDADVERFVQQIVPRVLAGQRTIATLTDTYLGQITGVSGSGVIDVSALRGVDPTVVYQRPAVQMRTDLAAGKAFPDALTASITRLTGLVATDLQMAHTNQARASLDARGVPGFRRVLVGPGDCALCVIASTQRYHRGNLLPIHPGCNCSVAPLQSGEPVPQVIDKALLEATHQQVAEFAGISDRGGRAPDYRQMLVTHDHGELGPVLSWRGQSFTGPGDLAS